MSSSCQDMRSDLIECIKLSGCLRDSDFHSCLKSDQLKSKGAQVTEVDFNDSEALKKVSRVIIWLININCII